jgi:N,N'-diacetyllegionaminate synthase
VSVFVIAEAGVNHNGSIDLAYKLIDVAYASGADAVKFQTFKAENLVIKNTQKAEYQKITTGSSESQFQMLKKLELDFKDHKKLLEYCKSKGIIFISSPFDFQSIDLLYELGLQILKIPSGEINNLAYLRYIGSLKRKIILSTGMSTINEIRVALEILEGSGTPKKHITILHANTMYPTPMEDVNLKAIKTIKDKFEVSVGYSDHTLGIEVSIAAVAMGATVIEKHFTLDKSMDGPDHRSSLNPNELKMMITAIRNIEKALGSSVKKPTQSEKPNIMLARKSIVASRSIKKGEVFTKKNITTKRPGRGTRPMKWDSIIGKVAKRDYQIDDLL